MNSITQKEVDRFWKKVDKECSQVFFNGSRCWEWGAACDTNGYGKMRIGNKIRSTHRISFELAYGDIPAGLLVLHYCDNRSCCNPRHFFLGTNKDNSEDMVQKGRQARGEKQGSAKLSDLQVAEIRRRYRPYGIGGENSYKLAKEFGVSRSNISEIVRFRKRKNVS